MTFAIYNRKGIEALMAKEQTGHNRNMTEEEEKAFLKKFRKKVNSRRNYRGKRNNKGVFGGV